MSGTDNKPQQPTAEQIRAASMAKVEHALALIERAKNDLDTACGDLSTLEGGIAVWKATAALSDRVNALWWKVHNQRGRFRLDRDNIAALARRLEAAAAEAEKSVA